MNSNCLLADLSFPNFVLCAILAVVQPLSCRWEIGSIFKYTGRKKEYSRKTLQDTFKNFAEGDQGKWVQETFSSLDKHFSLTYLQVGAQWFSVSSPQQLVSDIVEFGFQDQDWMHHCTFSSSGCGC